MLSCCHAATGAYRSRSADPPIPCVDKGWPDQKTGKEHMGRPAGLAVLGLAHEIHPHNPFFSKLQRVFFLIFFQYDSLRQIAQLANSTDRHNGLHCYVRLPLRFPCG